LLYKEVQKELSENTLSKGYKMKVAILTLVLVGSVFAKTAKVHSQHCAGEGNILVCVIK